MHQTKHTKSSRQKFQLFVLRNFSYLLPFLLIKRSEKSVEMESSLKKFKVGDSFVYTAVWQTLASVLIPPIFVHRTVLLTSSVLSKTSSPPLVRTWAPTLAGLAIIPFICHPIDHAVTSLLHYTYLPASLYLLQNFLPHSKRPPPLLPPSTHQTEDNDSKKAGK